MFKRPWERRQPVIVKPKEGCKIKIKKLSDGGKSIEFSGSCSKEQLEMARSSMDSEQDVNLED